MPDRPESDSPADYDPTLTSVIDEGRKFFRGLIDSNRALRVRVADLTATVDRLTVERAQVAPQLARLAELERLRAESEERAAALDRQLSELRGRWEDTDFDQQDLARRYAEVEEQYVTVTNLYVASYHLHATLQYRRVLGVVKEILANLVGAQRARLLLRRRDGQLVMVAAQGWPGEGHLVAGLERDPTVARVLAEGASQYRAEGEAGILACVPLRVLHRTVGVLVIDELLAHKPALTQTDTQIFDLLGAHVAVALFRSQRIRSGDEAAPTGVDSLSGEALDLTDLLLVG